MAPDDPTELRSALRDATLELVRIPSVIGDEARICDHVERRLLQTLPREAITRYGHSLVAAAPSSRSDPAGPSGQPGRPTIALVGHLDTVPCRQSAEPWADDERVHGCGASDMKAGLAVMLELARRLDRSTLAADLLLVFYEREEGPYEQNGLQPLLDEGLVRGVDLALCLEPTDNRLQVGSLGSIHCTLTFEGRRAHSARPWLGDNAIHRAGPLLVQLAARGRLARTVAGLDFYEVMSATLAEGGAARNVVPDRFAINLNYRFAPGRTLAEAQADVERFVGGRCQIAYTDLSPSGRVCLDSPLLARLLAAGDVHVEAKQAWTDVARLDQFGIAAANFGPGEGSQAHQEDESCPIAAIERGYRILERYLTL